MSTKFEGKYWRCVWQKYIHLIWNIVTSDLNTQKCNIHCLKHIEFINISEYFRIVLISLDVIKCADMEITFWGLCCFGYTHAHTYMYIYIYIYIYIKFYIILDHMVYITFPKNNVVVTNCVIQYEKHFEGFCCNSLQMRSFYVILLKVRYQFKVLLT